MTLAIFTCIIITQSSWKLWPMEKLQHLKCYQCSNIPYWNSAELWCNFITQWVSTICIYRAVLTAMVHPKNRNWHLSKSSKTFSQQRKFSPSYIIFFSLHIYCAGKSLVAVRFTLNSILYLQLTPSLFSHDWLVAYFISQALLKALDYNQW